MKKILSILLVLTMILAFGSFAAADEAKPLESLKKTYTGADLIPAETLSFDVEADEGNPDPEALISIADVDIDTTSADQTIPFTLPTYTKVGIYNYTITETAGDAQGVTYSTEKIAVVVLAEYYDDNGTQKIKATAYAAKAADAEEKLDTFTNEYGLGTLTVKKTVTGNLADQDKLFTIKVTLSTEKDLKVYSDISISGGSDSGNTQTITGNGWTGDQEITIKLKHNETVTFDNIPAGISYTVEEDSTHTTGELNSEEGYTASYTNKEGTIEADGTAAAEIVNEKKTEINTGIVLDSLPYILLAVLAIAAVAVLVIRRRRYSED